MKVLLIEPKGNTSSVNLGLLYLTTSIVSAGYQTHFLDLNRFSEELHKGLISNALNEVQPAVVGFSVFDINYHQVLKLCGWVKELYPQAHIVLGGPHTNALKEKILKNKDVDFAFHGECEKTFVEFLGHLKNSSSFNKLSGLIYRDENETLVNPSKLITDVDKIEPPNFKLWNVESLKMYLLITSRGCPFKCGFCTRNLGNKWRPRDPAKCVDELFEAREKLGMKAFRIVDASFNMRENHVLNFCSEITRRKLDRPWMASGIRADLLTTEMTKALGDAGCKMVVIGVESISPRVCEYMKKDLKIDKAKKGIQLCHEQNILVNVNLMVGLPGDNYSDSLKYGKEVIDWGCNAYCINHAVPLDGTDLHDWVEKNGKINSNFNWLNAYSDECPAFETADFSFQERLEVRKILRDYDHSKNSKARQNNKLDWVYPETCDYAKSPDGLAPCRP